MRRRNFLLLAVGLGSPPVLAALADNQRRTDHNAAHCKAQNTESCFMFSAHDDHDGNHYVSRSNWQNTDKLSCAIPFRAHDILPLSCTQAIAFGRRPHPQSIRVDLETRATQLITAQSGRHFYGHGCLSADESVLFTTENDYAAARGVIGIRDARTLRQMGEYASYGVGPHDIQLMPDGKTLVIANGGIQTHPDYGRRKLNLKTMQPSLVYVDSVTGQKLDEYRLADHLLSIRHLTITTTGNVGVATQYQGDIYRQQPETLVAWQYAGGALEALSAPAAELENCRGYMADLAYDPTQEIIAATSPRGNQITFWHTRESRYLYQLAVPEVSGIQFLPHTDCFLASNARGECLLIKATSQTARIISRHAFPDTIWDNHLLIGG